MKNISEYKVEYPKCPSGGLHQGQDLNSICMGEKCKFSLMCSFCKIEHHSNHPTQTLKHYLESVRAEIDTKKGNGINVALVEERKEGFLEVMRQGVQELASLFRELEGVVINVFNKIRDEVEQKRLAQEEFLRLYSNLEGQKLTLNASSIVNYSNSNKKIVLPYPQDLVEFFEQSKQKLKQANTHYTSILQKEAQIIKPTLKAQPSFLNKIMLPEQATFVNRVLTQNKEGQDNLVLLYDEQNLEMFKLTLQLLDKPQKLYVGVMTKSAYQSQPKKFDAKLALAQKGISWVCSDGTSSRSKINTIEKYSPNQLISLTLRKDQLVVKKKSDKQYAILLPDPSPSGRRYFFIAMQGLGRIQVMECQYEKS